MNKRIAAVITVVALGAVTPQFAKAVAQIAPSPGIASDDIGEDGLKRRGDGSVDDSQPGVADDQRRGRGRERGGDQDSDERTGRNGDHERGRDRERDRDQDRDRGRGRDRH